MNPVILYAAMSLDGYLADENGGVAWLQGDGSDPDHPGTYEVFLKDVDAIVMGYRTFAQIVNELSKDVWPYPGKDCHVLTHRTGLVDPRVSFAGDPKGLIQRLKDEAKGAIWICGGASVVWECLKERWIDELRIAVVPILLGGGIPLFQKGFESQTWTLVDTTTYNGFVELHYKKADRDVV
jgi:dihydrofolate reductase